MTDEAVERGPNYDWQHEAVHYKMECDKLRELLRKVEASGEETQVKLDEMTDNERVTSELFEALSLDCAELQFKLADTIKELSACKTSPGGCGYWKERCAKLENKPDTRLVHLNKSLKIIEKVLNLRGACWGDLEDAAGEIRSILSESEKKCNHDGTTMCPRCWTTPEEDTEKDSNEKI